MSEAADEGVSLPPGDAAFGALMAVLAPETEEQGAAAGAGTEDAAGQPAGGAAPDAGQAGAPAGGAGTDAPPAAGGGGTAAPAAGGAGAPAGDGVADATPAGGADAGADTGRPAAWTAAADDVVPKFGELSTAFEESTAKAYHETALAEMREEHAPYFEALETHPRMLVGKDVPAIGKEGMERLQSTDDAREWQDAVKQVMVDELKARTTQSMEEDNGFLSTIHSSIELFQNNHDLIPYTKGFDVDLANRFTTLAKPYELRSEDGKLQGYSIPVQGLIENLRTALNTERANKPAAPAAPSATTAGPAGGAAAPATPAEQPQGGITSKAGDSGGKEDFSTLFGTIGLPNLVI